MEYIESQLRQLIGSIIRMEKMQEKQAQQYLKKANSLEVITIILLVCIIGATISNIFVDNFWLKVASAVLAGLGLFISTYLKSHDLKGAYQKCRETDMLLLHLKEDTVSSICDIKSEILDKKEAKEKRNEYQKIYLEICKNAPEVKKIIGKKVQKEMNHLQDNTFSNGQIDSYLPAELRKS